MGKYNFIVDGINPNSTHGKILREVPTGSTVLECGCATGYMTKFMKEMLCCTVDVIEYDHEAIQSAKQYARKAICEDIEKISFRNSDVLYDRIIFADVLEHLRNPMDVLRDVSGLLKEDGKILVSIPNICHNDIIIRLFNDCFTYTSLGLLDNTHIHFWGVRDFLQQCESIGLKADKVDGVQFRTGSTEQRLPPELVDKDLLKVLKTREYGEVYQWVFVLQKG